MAGANEKRLDAVRSKSFFFAPQCGSRSAKSVLAAGLFFATLCRSTAMLAGPLLDEGNGLGGRRGAGKPIGEIHRAIRETTLPS